MHDSQLLLHGGGVHAVMVCVVALQIIGVEPTESNVLSGGTPGKTVFVKMKILSLFSVTVLEVVKLFHLKGLEFNTFQKHIRAIHERALALDAWVAVCCEGPCVVGGRVRWGGGMIDVCKWGTGCTWCPA